MRKVWSFAKREYPYIWALFILLTGVVAMWIFWLVKPGDVRPGFTDYNAAVFGDIFLSLLVFTCAKYIQMATEKEMDDSDNPPINDESQESSEPPRKKKVIIPWIVGCLSGLVGLVWQISWLFGVPENWTIVKLDKPKTVLGMEIKMKFLCPGVWHACFFVASFAIIGYFLTRFICVHANVRREGCLENYYNCLLLGIVFSGCFYIAMIASDNLEPHLSRFIMIPLVCFGAMTTLLLFVEIPSFRKKEPGKMKEIIAAMSGCIMAIAESFFILFSLQSFDWFAFFCCIVVSFSFVILVYDEKITRVEKGMTIWNAVSTFVVPSALAFICLFHEFSIDTAIWIGLIFVWPFMVALVHRKEFIVYYGWSTKESKFEAALIWILLFPSFLLAYLIVTSTVRIDQVSDFFKEIVRYIEYPIVFFGVLVAQKLFEPIKQLDSSVDVPKQASYMKKLQYIKVLVIPFCCYIRLLAESYSKLRGFQKPEWIQYFPKYALILFGPCAYYLVLKKIIGEKKRAAAWLFSVVTYVTLILASFFLGKLNECSTWENAKDFFANGNKIAIALVLFSAIAQILGTSKMLSLTFFSNTFSIRGYSSEISRGIEKRVKEMAIVILVGNAVLTLIFCLLIVSASSSGINVPLFVGFIAILLMSYVVVPFFLHTLIREELPEYSLKIVNGTPWMEIAKDGIMAFFVFALAAGYPLFVIKYLDASIATFWNVLLFAIFGMVSMYAALTFCCENNKEHFQTLVDRIVCHHDDPILATLNDEEKKKYIVVEEDDEALFQSVVNRKSSMMKELYKHLNLQCWASFFSCLVYSFFFAGFAVILKAARAHNMGIPKAFREYMKDFFPDKTLIDRCTD